MTVQELYEKASRDRGLQDAYEKAAKENRLEAFFVEQGIEGTPAEFMRYLQEKANTPLADEQLEDVSAGRNIPALIAAMPKKEGERGADGVLPR